MLRNIDGMEAQRSENLHMLFGQLKHPLKTIGAHRWDDQLAHTGRFAWCRLSVSAPVKGGKSKWQCVSISGKLTNSHPRYKDALRPVAFHYGQPQPVGCHHETHWLLGAPFHHRLPYRSKRRDRE